MDKELCRVYAHALSGHVRYPLGLSQTMEIDVGKSGRGAAVEGLISFSDLGSVSVCFSRPLIYLVYDYE